MFSQSPATMANDAVRQLAAQQRLDLLNSIAEAFIIDETLPEDEVGFCADLEHYTLACNLILTYGAALGTMYHGFVMACNGDPPTDIAVRRANMLKFRGWAGVIEQALRDRAGARVV